MHFENIPVNSLKIICWVPCRIKQYYNIRTHKIKTQSTSPKTIKQKKQNWQNYVIARTTLFFPPNVLGPYKHESSLPH